MTRACTGRRPQGAGGWAKLALASAVLLYLWLQLPEAGLIPWVRGYGHGTRSGIVYSAPVETKVVAITFDDGPDPEVTPAVLEALRERSVRCTFFLTGVMTVKYADVARQVAADGHEIASHGYSHRALRGADAETIRRELRRTEVVLERVLGVRPTLFRFPYLVHDEEALRVVQSRGYTVIACSLDSRDWLTPDARRLASRVCGLIRPGDIVLMHDAAGQKGEKMKEALDIILEWLHENGYRCVTVSELIRMGAEAGGRPGP